MTTSRFSFPTTIHFGPGARALVADHLKNEDVLRPIIVTDRGIAPLPLLADFVASLSAFHVGVFSGIWGNPVRSQVREGVAAYKAHRADGVIGLGGGAALDVAKADRADGDAPGRHPRIRVGPSAGAADRPLAAALRRACRPPPAPAPKSAARRWSPTTRRT